MYKSVSIAAVVGALALVAGCDKIGGAGDVDQSKMCIASTDQKAMQCPDGELILARLSPGMTGNRAYNVLNTIALYCDTNQPVTYNEAGVICVMTHARIDTLTGNAAPQGQPTQQQQFQQPRPAPPQQNPNSQQNAVPGTFNNGLQDNGAQNTAQ